MICYSFIQNLKCFQNASIALSSQLCLWARQIVFRGATSPQTKSQNDSVLGKALFATRLLAEGQLASVNPACPATLTQRHSGSENEQQLASQEGLQQLKRVVYLLGKLQVTGPMISINAKHLRTSPKILSSDDRLSREA